jgi:hypothetical protein
MREIWVYEEYYITLFLGISYVMLRAFENFHRTLVPHSFLDLDVHGPVFTLAAWIVYDRTQASIRHPCVRVWRTCNYTCGVNWPIGLEYLGTEVHFCLNTSIRNEEVVSFLTSPKLQNLKRGREALTKPRERGHTRFSVFGKDGREI